VVDREDFVDDDLRAGRRSGRHGEENAEDHSGAAASPEASVRWDRDHGFERVPPPPRCQGARRSRAFLERPPQAAGSPPLRLARLAPVGVAVLVPSVAVETATVRWLYGDRHAGQSGKHLRFGPDATWRTQPLRKGQDHR
jgi:hypothetical protein